MAEYIFNWRYRSGDRNTLLAHATNTKSDVERATLTDVLPADVRESNILVTGPTLSDKDHLAFDILSTSWENETTPFLITATEPESLARSRCESLMPAKYRTGELYVIDCAEAPQAPDRVHDSSCSVTTPADLTGISICLSKGYERYEETGGRRILLDNLSTLLIYSELDRVYRFISAINRRVTDVNDATVQLLDRDSLDSTERNTLAQLFPTVIEVRNEDDTMLFRVRGTTETDWYEYRSPWGEKQ